MDWNRKDNREVLREVTVPIKEGDFPLLKFPLLEETGLVEHCFTTRYGGASEGEFSSLNLSYTRGDQTAAVDENFRRLAAAIGVTTGDFVFSDQTHTTNVLRVGKEDKGSGILRPRPYHNVDGLITDEPQVVLSTFFADCVPLYFVDTKRKAIGLSHSGWRGTADRMGEKTLKAMAREFGTDPADVIAAVGPSICRDCYEIGSDVAEVFMERFPERFFRFLKEKGGGKYQLDLWKCNELILLDAGILPEHLTVTDICTCCNPTLLFSHRASKGRRGNLGAFLYLRR